MLYQLMAAYTQLMGTAASCLNHASPPFFQLIVSLKFPSNKHKYILNSHWNRQINVCILNDDG